MPHIKSIRLVNVQYNNETQMYDDFYMDFNGEDSVFSLRNGGGKTILFQMILQTVLPKAYLSKEKPLALIFEGKNVTVSIPGEALSDGASGETITVRNLQSKKQLRATVRDGQTVIVK